MPSPCRSTGVSAPPIEDRHPLKRRKRRRRAAGGPLFRFVQVADTHIMQPESAAILGLALERIDSINEAVFVVFSGDMVETGEPEQYRIFLQTVSGLSLPCYAVVGNHDIGNMSSRRRYSRFFGPPSYRFDVEGVACLVLDTNNSDREPGNWHGRVERPAMGWLARTLNRLDGDAPIILFTHHGLVGSRDDLECDVGNADEVLARLCRRRILAGFAGHAHRLRVVRHSGADYFICPALSTRRANKGGEPPGMLVVDVYENGVEASLLIVPGSPTGKGI